MINNSLDVSINTKAQTMPSIRKYKVIGFLYCSCYREAYNII